MFKDIQECSRIYKSVQGYATNISIVCKNIQRYLEGGARQQYTGIHRAAPRVYRDILMCTNIQDRVYKSVARCIRVCYIII